MIEQQDQLSTIQDMDMVLHGIYHISNRQKPNKYGWSKHSWHLKGLAISAESLEQEQRTAADLTLVDQTKVLVQQYQMQL